jgi:hypothetical protein
MRSTKIVFNVFTFLLGIQITFAQLPVLSDQNIDFSNAISTISTGDWSNPNIWNGGVVPGASDDVIVNHTVYIDIQGDSSGAIVDLCRNIKVNQNGVLRIGHDNDNFKKELRINGSIICNGTFSAGRIQPGSSGTGEIYTNNANINLNLSGNDTAYISGSGFFNPHDVKITSSTADKNLVVDLYNMITDGNFVVKSNNRVHVEITKYAYLNIKGTLGLTGATYQYSSATAKADLVVHGVVLANDVSLFTKNTTSGEGSSITIKDRGSLTVSKINNANLNKKTEAAGYALTIDQGGLFKLGEGINFYNLTLDNNNFVLTNNGEVRYHYSETLPSESAITASIDVYDPNLGADASQIKDVFGASHIAGWYNFTNKPFMEEGLDFYEQFGATSIKTTLTAENGKMWKAYPFNSSWPNFNTLKEIAQHPEIINLFQRQNIKTHTFWTTTKNKGDWKTYGPDLDHSSYLNEEEQFYDLTKYLLDTYGSMNKVFVYQNWEGDWMLRGQAVIWEDLNHNNYQPVPDDVQWNIEGMSRMFRARQRGTERARDEYSNAVAKVFHGIEFNKLWWNDSGTRKTMMDSGIPCVIGDVVPKTRLDLTSWSAYDGGWTNNDNPHGHAMWKGLEMARYFTNETKAINSDFPVQIGEFAINENWPTNNKISKNTIESRYGRYIGVALGLGIPNFYLWNLYCSGQQGGPDGHTWEKGVQYDDSFLYEWMDGKWLIEPDGSWGHAAYFLMSQYQQNPNESITLNSNQIEISKISLYPNPATEYFYIEGLQQTVNVSFYSMDGKHIKSFEHNPQSPIQTKDLNSGTYLVSIKSYVDGPTKLLIINK